MRTIAAVLLAVTLALSGCTLLTGNKPTPTPSTTTPIPTPETTTPEVTTTPVTTTPSTTTTTTPPTPTGIPSDAYSVAIAGAPTIIEAGVPFNFTLFANGSTPRSADAISGAYGPATTTTPTMTAYANGCAKQTGTVPGSFLVNCTIPNAGDAFLRGHFVAGGTDFWSPETRITVRAPIGSFVVTSPNATADPTGQNDAQLPQAQSGHPYTFDLNVTGPTTESATNITARFVGSTTVGATGSSAASCNHQSGSIPGVFTVTCTFTSTSLTVSTYTVVGHLEVLIGNNVHNFESPHYSVPVLPASLV